VVDEAALVVVDCADPVVVVVTCIVVEVDSVLFGGSSDVVVAVLDVEPGPEVLVVSLTTAVSSPQAAASRTRAAVTVMSTLLSERRILI
jgi:hypothetical protein